MEFTGQNSTIIFLMFIILLVVLGIVSFHYYAYVTTHRNISAGIGAGFTIFPDQN